MTGQESNCSSPTAGTAEYTGGTDVIYIGSKTESEVTFLYSMEQNSSNLEVNILEDSNIVSVFSKDNINMEDQSLDDTLPLSPVNNTNPEKKEDLSSPPWSCTARAHCSFF